MSEDMSGTNSPNGTDPNYAYGWLIAYLKGIERNRTHLTSDRLTAHTARFQGEDAATAMRMVDAIATATKGVVPLAPGEGNVEDRYNAMCDERTLRNRDGTVGPTVVA